MTTTRHGRACGFTLIELLIVISILGVLAAVLVPNLIGANDAASEAATEANMIVLENGIKTHERKHGFAPPDDLKPVAADAKAPWKPDNGRNTGIESLVCFLSNSLQDGVDLGGMANAFTNTDADDHGVEMPLLKSRERREIADGFTTPMAYFGKFGLGKTQTMLLGVDGEQAAVKAMLRPDGKPFGDGKWQILSAGKDRTFGTADDLAWPKN
ncbi:MAG: type II secretion system protein [Planctomycetes bacterium]|nr:type II secretion system protein [Planctomycetota bacterium]